MRAFQRSIALLSSLLLLLAGFIFAPTAPATALTPAAEDSPPVELVDGTPHSEHTFEPSGAGLQAEAAGSPAGDIKVRLVTVKLADNSNPVSMTGAEQSIQAASSYWQAMTNTHLSMTVSSRLESFQSAAKSTQSYFDIMTQITSELNWTNSAYTALVVFIPASSLSGGALGAGWSSNGNSGRVLMPQISNFSHNVITHEFGHVIGLMHADALQCGSGASDVGTTSTGQFTDSSCYIREYGDTTDLMGAARYDIPVVSSSFWDYLGLGRGDEIRNLGVASGTNSYILKPWGGTEANRAVKFTDPVSNEVYYVELRLPVGYDQYLSYSGNAGNNGVKIVQSGGATAASSLILMPSTIPFSGYYSPNQAWQAGSTFVTHTGTRVTVNSVTGTDATVTIDADPRLRAKIQFSAGDFNGDGRPDVVSRETDGSLTLLMGLAGHQVGSPVRIGTGWDIFNAVLGIRDFNGDGFADVIARSSDGALWLYPGNGNGGFLSRQQIGSGWHVFERIVSADDFNGDGRSDLIASGSDGILWLYPGNGTGGFLPRVQIGAEWDVFNAVASAGSFAGGAAGLLARGADGTLYLYPGNGSGGFLPRKTIGVGWNSFSDLISGQDFTGDRLTDVLAANTAGDLLVYPGDGSGGFAPRLAVGTGWDQFSQVWPAGDFDGDGKADVLARSGDGSLWLNPGNGSGNFMPRRQIGSGWNQFNRVVGTGDFSGDGRPDLVARAEDGSLWLYPTDGKGNFQPRAYIGSGWEIFSQVLTPGDFDGDGRPDILAQSVDGTLWLYPGNGTGGFQARKAIGSGWGISNLTLGGGDFNGDGKADLMSRGNDGILWLYPGNGTSGFLPRVAIGTSWNSFTSVSSVGRFAGTANPNILATAQDGTLWLYTGTGRGAFQSTVLNPR